MSSDSQNGGRNACFLAGLALAFSALASCAPQPTASQPTLRTTTLRPDGDRPRRAACANGEDFVASKVRHLAGPPDVGFRYGTNGYDAPAETRTKYRPPRYDSVVTDNQSRLLSQAYDELSGRAKDEICTKVDWVFVDDSADNFHEKDAPHVANIDAAGWAFWEVTGAQVNRYPGTRKPFGPEADQGQGRGTFVALSSAFLASPPTLSALETETARSLLQAESAGAARTFPVITVFPASRDTPIAAIAAALMHDLGHLEWHLKCFPEPNRACTAFRNQSWRKDLNWPAKGIHAAGQDLGAQRVDSPQPGLREFARGSESLALARYLGLDRSRKTLWTSVMAGIAPDEDLAETFKYSALASRGIDVRVAFREQTTSFCTQLQTNVQFQRKVARLTRLLDADAPNCPAGLP